MKIREIGEIVCCPTDNKNKLSPSSQAVATCTDRARNLPGPECSGFHPNRSTFGGVIAERVNTAKTHRNVNPIFD